MWFSMPLRSAAASKSEASPAQEQQALQELAALESDLLELRREYDAADATALQSAVTWWLWQHAARFDFLHPVLAALARREEMKFAQIRFKPLPIPPDAGPRQRQLLEELNTMQSALSGLRRQASADGSDRFQELIQRWETANAARLAAHVQLAKAQSLEDAAKFKEREVVIEIPSDASAEERSFLLERAAVLDEMAELRALYKGASDDARQRAVALWQDQNAARLAVHFEQAARLSLP